MTPDRIWAVTRHSDIVGYGDWSDIEEGIDGEAAYLRVDGPTIQAVREALAEACEEVEAAVLAEYGYPKVHPANRFRFFCDISKVSEWRAALKKLEGE